MRLQRARIRGGTENIHLRGDRRVDHGEYSRCSSESWNLSTRSLKCGTG
jgi:hypothetical protein